ncbi:hypothetical protein ABPG74_000840 [Tetrahymena malaccensis]
MLAQISFCYYRSINNQNIMLFNLIDFFKAFVQVQYMKVFQSLIGQLIKTVKYIENVNKIIHQLKIESKLVINLLSFNLNFECKLLSNLGFQKKAYFKTFTSFRIDHSVQLRNKLQSGLWVFLKAFLQVRYLKMFKSLISLIPQLLNFNKNKQQTASQLIKTIKYIQNVNKIINQYKIES